MQGAIIGQINIIGEINQDTYINVLAESRNLPADEKKVQVNIDSPGGNEAVSDKIASFLDTLGREVTTVQTGIVASAAVKIFLKGVVRKANANYPFLIHNTHIDPQDIPVNLDANNSQELANMLQESRKNLASFYAKATGNNEDAIIAVMDADQPMSATQAVSLGFATEITNEIPILAKINMNVIKEYIAKIKANLAPATPTPAPVPAPAVVAMKVGDPAPAGAQEGDNEMGDLIVTVAGGKITEIKPKSAPAPTMAQVNALEQNLTAIAEQVASLSELMKAKMDADKVITESIIEIKNNIKGKHTPPKKVENRNQPATEKPLELKALMALNKPDTMAEFKAEYFKKFGQEPEAE